MSDQSRVGTAISESSAVGRAAPIFVPTGRQIDGSDYCWSQAQVWAHLDDQKKIASYPLSQAFTLALASIEPLHEVELTCYRGRSFRESCVPTSNDMGPPPADKVANERYNYDGQPVLYLCDSIEGVAREMKSREMKQDQMCVWFQGYTLPLEGLYIADFRPPSVESLPLLNHAFWWAEIANKEDGTKFLFSQFLAGGVANLFDGMIVPGVRGDDPTRYDNIVIFRPDRWRDWLTKGCSPQRLPNRHDKK